MFADAAGDKVKYHQQKGPKIDPPPLIQIGYLELLEPSTDIDSISHISSIIWSTVVIPSTASTFSTKP